MRVAVTGASGFIGRRTVAQLEADGHVVLPLDARNGVDLRTADLGKLLRNEDAVIHLAGVLGTSELFAQAQLAIDVNISATLRVLEACRRWDVRYVGITMPDCWPSLYQATKLAAVRIAAAYHHTYDFPVTHVRAFNAYGPGQAFGPGHPQKIVPTFARHIWDGTPVPIWGDGEQTTDLVHVDHIARCLVDAAVDRHGLCGRGETWDAGTGVETTVLEAARLVAAVADQPCRVEFLPMRAGELPNTRLCATDPGPFGYDLFDLDLFRETVESYREPRE